MIHQLVDNTLTRDADGITARCICGWSSRGHFTSLAASARFQDHAEQEPRTAFPETPDANPP